MNLYLGFDGGGTKTAALIMTQEGNVLGEGQAGPGSLATTSLDRLQAALCDSAARALIAAGLPPNVKFSGLCAAMAGYSLEERRIEFLQTLPSWIDSQGYRVEPDFAAAYWGASHGEPGIAIIAGTGAVAYGRNEAGETHREDGLGFLLGDRGSGFNLGLRALRYTLDCMKEGRTDRLSEAVLQHTGAVTQSQILQWLYGDFQPARVAALAPIVGELAEEGDPASRSHLAAMARYLRHSVRQVRHKLWLSRTAHVYMLGGLWSLGEFFRGEFTQPRWTSDGPVPCEAEDMPGGHFLISEPKNGAAYGAALLARGDDRRAAEGL